jgi:hypothetical protein
MKTINAAIFPPQQLGTFEDCHIKWAINGFIALCDNGLKVPVKKVEQVFAHNSCRVHPNALPKLPEWTK